MKFPEAWLREFCNPPISTEALAELLTMSGMEVEESSPVAPWFSGVVVAQVRSVEPHPNAEKLRVCEVDTGQGNLLTIVCGAPNVRAGIKVPCAILGAMLPRAAGASGNGGPLEIKHTVLRGVASEGMLCSARELQLADDEGGLLILDEVAQVGQNLRDYLRLDETLFTLKLTPNLGHCLSVYGIAREVSALTGAPLRVPSIPAAPVSNVGTLPVTIEAKDLCGRFSGRILRNVDARAKTPAWMVERLARCGQRSVTALVDISNYVMFEYGQPSHIFDLDKISGGLVVRWGRAGEKLKLLNGDEVEVDPGVGVVADGTAVESLAGIMGGDATAVSDATRNVYVEAAFWWPESVAGRSRRFGFSTDAGHRFERGVDPASTVARVERITELILQICGGQAGPIDDQCPNLPVRHPVTLRVERAAKVIGMPVTQDQCETVMRRLGLEFVSAPGRLTVTPPSWRFDLQIEEDLIEEVIRVVGYSSLPTSAPRADLTARVRSEGQRGPDALRRRIASLDYHETINFSFVDERWERELCGAANPIRVVNPMTTQLAVMRSSLIGSLMEVLRVNLARKATRVRVFEVGRVFLRDDAAADGDAAVAGVRQPIRVAGLVWGSAAPVQWGVRERAVDFFDVKGDVETLFAPRRPRFVATTHPAMHPGRCANIEVSGRVVGLLGELHPKWRQTYELPSAPVMFELDEGALLERDVAMFAPVQRQQSVWRDLSVVGSGSVTHEALMDVIGNVQQRVVRSARLFDLYVPAPETPGFEPGERSLAVRLELLDDETPLTDERIDLVVADVLKALQSRLGVRLRG